MAYLPGDLIVSGGHTSMIVADRGNQMLDVVHATVEQGIVRYTKYLDPDVAEQVNESHEDFVANAIVSGDVYRCTSRGTTVAPIAARVDDPETVAEGPPGAAVRTGYPRPSTPQVLDDRSKGVWSRETTSPPFEFDALFRTLKWAATHDHAFSEHRGATCCAFVVACWQTASLLWWASQADPPGARGRLQRCYQSLRDARGPKKVVPPEVPLIPTSREDVSISPKPKREWANRGTTLDEGFDATFERVARGLSRFTGQPDGIATTPATLFTPALVVDARFDYSMKLLFRLQTDATWEEIGTID